MSTDHTMLSPWRTTVELRTLSPVAALAFVALSFGCSTAPGRGFVAEGDTGAIVSDLGEQGDATGCPNAGEVLCRGNCIDLRNDPNNCGGCGRACPEGQSCVVGVCMAGCPPGQLRCDGRCSNPNTDRSNCGGCGRACQSGLVCAMGRCDVTCTAPLQRCDNTVVIEPDAGPIDSGRPDTGPPDTGAVDTGRDTGRDTR